MLVARTQFYGLQWRISGPYLQTAAGTPYPDVLLGSRGAFLDNLEISVLTQGVKNKFTGTVDDPGDFDNYQANGCQPFFLPNAAAASASNVISGGVPMWPGVSTLDFPPQPVPTPLVPVPARVTVTAPSK